MIMQLKFSFWPLERTAVVVMCASAHEPQTPEGNYYYFGSLAVEPLLDFFMTL